jgi:hypothetical protein
MAAKFEQWFNEKYGKSQSYGRGVAFEAWNTAIKSCDSQEVQEGLHRSSFRYECNACGNCICYSKPKEDWGLPVKDKCLYNVGYSANWRKKMSQDSYAYNHRRMWNEVIGTARRIPDQDFLNEYLVSTLKTIVIRRLFGDIKMVGDCFGCQWSVDQTGKFDCQYCLFDVQDTDAKGCLDGVWAKFELTKNREDFIAVCQEVRDLPIRKAKINKLPRAVPQKNPRVGG